MRRAPPGELMAKYPYVGFIGECDRGEKPDELTLGFFVTAATDEVVPVADEAIIAMAHAVSRGFSIMIGATSQALLKQVADHLEERIRFARQDVRGTA